MRRFVLATLALAALTATAPVANAALLTADDAVKIALKKSTSIIQANASVLDARSGMWSAYSGVLPRVTASYSRAADKFYQPEFDYSYTGAGGLQGSWSILSPTNIATWASARKGMKSAQLDRDAAAADVVLSTKRQFYVVVQAMHQSRVNSQSLRLARDDERRVKALFEVGSVSKSELLRARVRTSQAELDSLSADHAVTNQRIQLAELIGVPEPSLGDIDSTLTSSAATFVFDDVFADAKAHRPDVQAAEAAYSAASTGVLAARLARIPSLTASVDWTNYADNTFAWTHHKGGELALTMPVFDASVESRSATSRARLLRARETRDAVVRNLQSEVELTLLAHQESIEREALARSAVESATENLNLVQQKYNVGSATILDLIDSQVSYQRAESDLIFALAAIRVSEAAIDKVRGRTE